MEINIFGLKCDHCSYRDDTIPFSEYKDSIGKPCPECGNSLLTQEDYDKCVKSYSLAETYNKIADILKWLNPMHYVRLLFGIKQKQYDVTIRYENKNK